MLDTLKVGDKITVNAWKDFPAFSMTCIEITSYQSLNISEAKFKFDNGFELFESDLFNNMVLWSKRNGFTIEEVAK